MARLIHPPIPENPMKNRTANTPHLNPIHDTAGARGIYSRLVGIASAILSHDLLALVNRLALAGVFWLSGRTKVEGLLTINDNALLLFQDEYKLPLIPSEWAAYAAAYSEHLFPILLVFGLFTRFAAISLLGMTAVIQVFVYPGAWATHLTWAGLALYLVARGGGTLSVDHRLRIQ
jgi:putative oxidoreductase